jgi:hypothetical protein
MAGGTLLAAPSARSMKSSQILIVLLTLGAMGCGAPEARRPTPPADRTHTEVTMVPAYMPDRTTRSDAPDLVCPMDLHDASVEAVTTARGAALVFRAAPNARPELASRAELLLERYRGDTRYDVKLERFAQGMKLVFRAEPGEGEQLRSALLRHADTMNRTGRCPLTL